MWPLYRLSDAASEGPRRAHACLRAQSCLTLCDPTDCSLPGSSFHGILQARILEGVAISYFRGSSPPRDRTHFSWVSCIGRWMLYHCAPANPTKSTEDVITGWVSEWVSEVARLCPTLCDPMDWSLPASSIHGIFQARVLEWVAISFSRRSSRPRDWTWVSHIVGRRFTIWANREVHYRLRDQQM